MSSSARVLTGLVERRELEAAFGTLAGAGNLDQLAERAAGIAKQGLQALPVLLSLLDTPDPQLRGGLGQIAALLDRRPVVAALREAARAPARSDQARLTAIMILDRYLQEPIEESLMAGLRDPDAVALQSLRELVHEMDQNQFVVIEYLNQLREQPADVALIVLEAIPHLPANRHVTTLLLMLAQDPDPQLARSALDRLSRTRSPEAVAALRSLCMVLTPELAPIAERGLRKLMFTGVAEQEASPSDGRMRALMSPVDGTGAQVVWFVGQELHQGQGTLLSVLCQDPGGIIGCFGSTEVAADALPPAQPLGSTFVVRQADGAAPIELLEVPFNAGRQAVREAMALNWRHASPTPMEYRLLSPMIWDGSPIGPATSVASGDWGPEQASAVLDHPAFANWLWQGLPLYDAALELTHRHSEAARRQKIDWLASNYFDAALIRCYSRRLTRMATWLALAAQPVAAGLAQSAAEHLQSAPPAAAPLVRRMIGAGLDVAAVTLSDRPGRRKGQSPASRLRESEPAGRQ